VIVDGSTRKAEVTRGVVLPLVVLVVLVALGVATKQYAVCVALMAVVPMFSAVFATIPFTGLVAVVTFVAGIGVSLLAGSDTFSDMLLPLIALIVFAAIAVIASRFRVSETIVAAPPPERRKAMQFQLQTQADTDSMTGLLNRRGAIRALGPRNSGSDRVVAFLDCDLFKSVNEQYGSDVGDEFLQAIAGRLRHSLPSHDTVARWDGDEFLLAVSADAKSARPALQRVIGTINGHPIRTTAGPIPATVSVGAASWGPGQELEDVISRAGRALYGAKTAGRGRIVVDGEGGDSPAATHEPDEVADLHAEAENAADETPADQA
jgi:diguanylate cyclase (GGDEF)-like protein